MNRLTRPCENIENGKYAPYTVGAYTGIFPDCTLGEVVTRLAYYEDLEEQGRLVIVEETNEHPCRNCGMGWGTISYEGYHGCEETCEKLKRYYESIEI
jgi:hypothetical protein